MVRWFAVAGAGRDFACRLRVDGVYGDMNVSAATRQFLARDQFPARPTARLCRQLADWSHPRGACAISGLARPWSASSLRRARPRSADFVAGLLLERLEVEGFEIDYTLNGGATSGVLDHSSRAKFFLTPFLGWQQTRPLLERWTWSPRAMLAYPLPPGDFDGRLSGPGFDLSTPSDGHCARDQDPYFTVGWRPDRRSG